MRHFLAAVRLIYRFLRHPDVVAVGATLGAIGTIWSGISSFFEDKPEILQLPPKIVQIDGELSVESGEYIYQANFLNQSNHVISLEKLVIFAADDSGVVLSGSKFTVDNGPIGPGESFPGVVAFKSSAVPRMLVTCYRFLDKKSDSVHSGHSVSSLHYHLPNMVSVMSGQPAHQLLVKDKQICG